MISHDMTYGIMSQKQRSELAGLVPEGIEFGCPLDRYTTLRVGGQAEAVCFPRNLSSLQQLVSFLRGANIPYLVMGKGSNLLVKDGGIRGVVIILKGELASIEKMQDNDRLLSAGGGTSISQLLSYCCLEGLAGLEFLAGIPGTVGGVVFMNAGAFGEETGNMVHEIGIVTANGKPVRLDGSMLRFSYRESSIQKGSVIHAVRFALQKDIKDRVSRRVSDYLKIRKETQPLDFASCGSVFRNPPGDHAGRLIDRAGLKGTRIGGAMISPKHANFIVNTGGARAEDILALMDLTVKKVREQTGIELRPEIEVVGEA
jgi:UDP-N-acetylmuramate dehydrogenase